MLVRDARLFGCLVACWRAVASGTCLNTNRGVQCVSVSLCPRGVFLCRPECVLSVPECHSQCLRLRVGVCACVVTIALVGVSIRSPRRFRSVSLVELKVCSGRYAKSNAANGGIIFGGPRRSLATASSSASSATYQKVIAVLRTKPEFVTSCQQTLRTNGGIERYAAAAAAAAEGSATQGPGEGFQRRC